MGEQKPDKKELNEKPNKKEPGQKPNKKEPGQTNKRKNPGDLPDAVLAQLLKGASDFHQKTIKKEDLRQVKYVDGEGKQHVVLLEHGDWENFKATGQLPKLMNVSDEMTKCRDLLEGSHF